MNTDIPAVLPRFRRLDSRRRAFVAEVAHELRTPLAAIKGFAQTLQESTVSDRDEREFLRTIERHSDRMYRLVEQLLDVCAEHRRRQSRPYYERIALEPFAQEVVAGLRPVLDNKSLTALLEIPPKLFLRGDRDQLTQVLQNLIDNAAKFSPAGGVILVSAKRRRGGRVLVRVADQGPGFDENDARRAFERFFRAPAAAAVPGVGLGLTIVKQLVRLHGGQVWAEPRSGGGAVVSFILPP
jgi:signal transduction histidine kinase